MPESWEPELPPRPSAPARRGFPLVLTLATCVSLAILIGLGTWQLQRLSWKRDVLARVAALEGAPARPAGGVLDSLAAGGDADFVRVRVSCPGLASAPYLELYSLRDGKAGSRLISACAVASASYRTLLVDRGFVADVISARPPTNPADQAPLEVVGVLRQPDKRSFVTPPNEVAANRWYDRDTAAMARALGASQPAPVFLFAETSSNPAWKALVPAPVPAEIPNRHLEYALTWFGLAAALAGVYAAMLFRRKP